MDTSSLMEQILSSDNLNRAYLQVVRNKGAEGVDGMKYTELKGHLAMNGENIKEQLRTRKYKPQPVRRVEIPKPDGGVRNLGVLIEPPCTERNARWCERSEFLSYEKFLLLDREFASALRFFRDYDNMKWD